MHGNAPDILIIFVESVKSSDLTLSYWEYHLPNRVVLG